MVKTTTKMTIKMMLMTVTVRSELFYVLNYSF